MTQPADPINFLVFSDDWGRHPSSPQHLFRRIIGRHRVLWVNTLGLRAARLDAFSLRRGCEKLREWCRPLRRVEDRLWVLAPVMLPAAGRVARAVNRRRLIGSVRRALRQLGMDQPILFATVPTAAPCLGEVGERAVVYYATDDYQLWPGADAEAVRRADEALARSADLVLACSAVLARRQAQINPNTVLLPHGVDYEHFAQAGNEPADLAAIGRPRACFFGLIYERIDLDRLDELARTEPGLQIVLIGPVTANLGGLANRRNVHVLGPRPYAELPRYLHAMDVFVVPYVADAGIRASAPLKVRECLAVGRPTVVRRLPDLEGLGDVITLYDQPEEFVPAVRAALADRDPARAAARRERVRGESWEARAETLWRELAERRIIRPAPASPGPAVEVSVRAEPDEDLRIYLVGRTDATIFHDPRWGEVFRRAYGNQTAYLVARRNGRVAGALALTEQRSVLFGRRLTSLPYFDAAGILADDGEAESALLAAAARRRDQAKARWVELRQAEPLGVKTPVRTDKVRLELELPGSVEALRKGLKDKVRNQIRKAERSGLEATRGGAELVDEFHAVYVRTMRDLGSPPHSRRFFAAIAERFAAEVWLFAVRRAGRCVAGAFALRDRDTLRVPWAASDWRVRELCPNMLLYARMLEAAVEAGLRRFDFGRSTRDSGTHRFKKQWGPEDRLLYWHYLPAAGQAQPGLRPESGPFRLLAAAWSRLPISLARRLGPTIIGKLA